MTSLRFSIFVRSLVFSMMSVVLAEPLLANRITDCSSSDLDCIIDGRLAL
jgi:hypothetical protein